MVSTLMQ